MKAFISILIIVNCFGLYGQKIEIFGGANDNIFHDYAIQEGHSMSTYKPGIGFVAGIGLDSVKMKWLTFRFTLQYENYKGQLSASNGGLGSGNTVDAKINKSVISLGIFPINVRLLKKIDLNLGVSISRLIGEKNDGTCRSWSLGYYDWSSAIQDKYSRYSSLVYFGLNGRIAYDFNLSKSIVISPQYMYYFGLTNEFVAFPEYTKSMRHNFCIGIKKKMK